MLTRNPRRRSAGFTLIELLVVIAVIGILMAILVPTILGLFTRTDDFAREVEIDQMAAACEKFKNEFGFYPVDFRYIDSAGAMLPYLNKIAPNHQELSADPVQVANGVAMPDSRLQVWWDNVGVALKDAADTNVRGHETALWFWLSQTYDNGQFPLTSTRDPADATRLIDERRVMFEFESGRLHDIYEDDMSKWVYYPDPTNATDTNAPNGTPNRFIVVHYEQAGGGGGPYIYFHHDSYGNPNNMPGDPGAILEVFDDGASLGIVSPYRIPGSAANTEDWGYYNPDTFQIICAGSNEHFADPDAAVAEVFADLEDVNGVYWRNPALPHQADNLANFGSGRLEALDSVLN